MNYKGNTVFGDGTGPDCGGKERPDFYGLCIHEKQKEYCKTCERDKFEDEQFVRYLRAERCYVRAQGLHELAIAGTSAIYTEYFDGMKRRAIDMRVYTALLNIHARRMDKNDK